ncbi:Oxaloacetate decarboxylase, gamma chain [Paucidesulfovibrio gracilis DSM 16080]|uniref:Oxaloacetate decarboxylase, gamma chain n=1 Tax=Paucidesulfovibrio gracilis DSM 16080 TaxID=1121449 RepID=A0A1T4XGG5_9BACT|nr:OadG family transporter subunit [Paucidesulfovibrio gracilis]SKA88175.1 Oxaloacetate decarboxylase, gamma chain [Paucidesulfovibrio gracilis DSM 16080]
MTVAAASLTPTGWNAVLDAGGPLLAITGMAVVFFALVSISLFITILPRALRLWDRLLPETPRKTSHPEPQPRVQVARTGSAPAGETLAALAAAAVLRHDPSVARHLGMTTNKRTAEN